MVDYISERREEEDGDVIVFTYYTLLNTNTGEIKMYKRKPKNDKIGPYHIPIKHEETVKIPASDSRWIEKDSELTLEQDKVNEMTAAKL